MISWLRNKQVLRNKEKKGDSAMIRKIVQIEEDRCTGCGLCAHACHESAIAMVDGKAKLIRDDYGDGFGDCLPVCPADAISFVEREALPYDEEAVKENQRKAKEAAGQENTGAGKAGENSWAIDRADAQENSAAVPSRLRQWPVQIKLVQERASMFAGADLLVARIFMRNDIKSITVARMEVPCCAGMERAVKMALKESGKKIPVKTVVISTEGEIL